MAKPGDTPPGNGGGDNGGGGQPPAGGGSGQPAGQQGGGGGTDDAQLGAAIEAAVRKVFAEATSAGGGQPPAGGSTGQAVPPPAAGPASQPPAGGDTGGGSIGDLINGAVRRALEERDRDDALAVLGDEIDSLKRQLSTRPDRKAGWGAFLLGPGFARR